MAADTAMSPAIPRWQIAVALIGFPALYLLNSFTPWTSRLFAQGDRNAFFPFYLSILSLHWASAALTVAMARRSGLTLEGLGFKLSPRQALGIVGRLVAIGVALVLFRQLVPYAMQRPGWLAFFPVTPVERLFFVLAALSAGFCEELVYRGFAITGLRSRWVQVRLAIALSTVAFALIHGLGGVYAFPIFFLAGLVYASIYLRERSLVPAMIAHAFWDMTAILVP